MKSELEYSVSPQIDLPILAYEVQRNNRDVPVQEKERNLGIEDAARERYEKLPLDRLQRRAHSIADLLPDEVQEKVKDRLAEIQSNEPELRNFMVEKLSYVEAAGKELADAKGEYDQASLELVATRGEQLIGVAIEKTQLSALQRKILSTSQYSSRLWQEGLVDHDPDLIVGAVLFSAPPVLLLPAYDAARSIDGTTEITNLSNVLTERLSGKNSVTLTNETGVIRQAMKEKFGAMPGDTKLINLQRLLQDKGQDIKGDDSLLAREWLADELSFLRTPAGSEMFSFVAQSKEHDAAEIRMQALAAARIDLNVQRGVISTPREYQAAIERAYVAVGKGEPIAEEDVVKVYQATQLIRGIVKGYELTEAVINRISEQSVQMQEDVASAGVIRTKEYIVAAIIANSDVFDVHQVSTGESIRTPRQLWTKVVQKATDFYQVSKTLSAELN